jgi:outer membrane protein
MLPVSRLFRFIIPLVAVTCAGCAIMDSPRTVRIEDYLAAPALKKNVAVTQTTETRATPIDEAATPEKPLTLSACVRIGLDENPTLRAAREGVAAARESVGMAKAPYYPTLGLGGAYRRWETHAFLPEGLPGVENLTVIGPTDDWSSGLLARFLIFDSGKRAAQLRTALSGQGIAEAEEAGIRQDIALAVHQAFYSSLSTLEAQTVAEQNKTRADDHLNLVREFRAAGAVPQADVIRAQVEVANAKLQLVKARSAIKFAGGNLNTAMGLPVEMKIDLDAENTNMVSPDSIDVYKAFDQAIQHRPVLKAALHRINIARNAIDIAKSAFGPVVMAIAGYGYRDSQFLPEDKDWSAGIGIEVPLFDGFKHSHDLSRTKHELAKEEAQVRHLVLKVREEVWNAHLALKESYEAAQASEAVVRDARESMRMTRERYEAGVATATDLLDANTTQTRADYMLVEARWNYHSAHAALDRATGAILDEGIQ